MNPPWGPLPAPCDDELLGSYLVRCALRHGSSPTRFCSFHLRGIEVWTRAIDRSATDDLLTRIAIGSALPIARVRKMTLKSLQELMPGAALPAEAPGMTTLGSTIETDTVMACVVVRIAYR